MRSLFLVGIKVRVPFTHSSIEEGNDWAVYGGDRLHVRLVERGYTLRLDIVKHRALSNLAKYSYILAQENYRD